jgi:hypothetical protein
MTVLERLAIIAFTLAALLLGTVFGVKHYGTERYDAGYSDAIAAGKQLHDRDAAAALKTESDLRQTLAEKDLKAHQKDQEHAQELADAQHRVLAGTDRLRCPASSVQPTATAADRSASVVAPVDPGGPDLVPEAAADVLGYGAAIAGLVSRYERLTERFEECRAVNAK